MHAFTCMWMHVVDGGKNAGMHVFRSSGRISRLQALDKTKIALFGFRPALCPASFRGVTWRINFIFLQAKTRTDHSGSRRRHAPVNFPYRGRNRTSTRRPRHSRAKPHPPLPKAPLNLLAPLLARSRSSSSRSRFRWSCCGGRSSICCFVSPSFPPAELWSWAWHGPGPAAMCLKFLFF
jgi:hypothetical protein